MATTWHRTRREEALAKSEFNTLTPQEKIELRVLEEVSLAELAFGAAKLPDPESKDDITDMAVSIVKSTDLPVAIVMNELPLIQSSMTLARQMIEHSGTDSTA